MDDIRWTDSGTGRQWDRDLSGDEVRGICTETKCNRNLSYLASRISNTPTIR